MGIKYIGNISYDEALFKSDSKIVIFGTGVYGKKVAEYLAQKHLKDRVLCFCDSNRDLKKINIMGISVGEPFEVCQKYPDADYLVIGKYSREMYGILNEHHINRIHILVD